MSGIQRTVFLQARPKTYIKDFFVKGGLVNNYKDGSLSTEVLLRSENEDKSEYLVEASLFDNMQKIYNQQIPATLVGKICNVNFTNIFPSVKRWSAETPDLYTMVLMSEREKRENS